VGTMSQTIAQRHGPRLHVRWVPILAVLATVLVAALALVIINRPSTTTTPPATTAGVAAAALVADMALPVTVTDRAAALTHYKRNYSPNVQFAPAALLSASGTRAAAFVKPPAALTYYKRNYSPNR
jgi:hypothetical protein